MKIAIVHDAFIEFGGAERVVLTLLDLYPDADVYIPLLKRSGRDELLKRTEGKIISSWLNHIPFLRFGSILLKPLLYLYWEQLDLKKYDLVISSSHSFSSKSVITSPHTLHISYVYTPPRYLYTEFNETRILQLPFMRTILSPLFSWLRVWDFIGAQRPDILIAISKEIQMRIKKYYRRDSVVIYPPVQIPTKRTKRNPQYFICVSRLARQKGIELAIHACNQLKERLVIVGEGTQEGYLRSIAGPTIEFFGNIPDKKMGHVWAGAKALIYPSIEEDFGIVPVEAMAHEVPVIAYKSGALQETIPSRWGGIFFNTLSVASLIDAISAWRNNQFDHQRMRLHAAKFSELKFKKRMRSFIAARL